jgi:hypothetical protein
MPCQQNNGFGMAFDTIFLQMKEVGGYGLPSNCIPEESEENSNE